MHIWYPVEKIEDVRSKFQKHFSTEEEPRFFSSPGRSEILGNHTDHQNGKVVVAAVDLDIRAAVLPRTDTLVRVYSENYGSFELTLDDLAMREDEKETTESLVRGIADAFHQRNLQFSGFDAYIQSDVPAGSGLSSSAAFELLLISIFDSIWNENQVNALERARIGQYAENQYFGKPSGLLDQSGCSFGGLAYIDFANGEINVDELHLDLEQYSFSMIVTNTHGSHADLTPEYAAVPYEMKKVAAFFGKETLSQVNEADFYHQLSTLRPEVGDRAILRAIHFFTEQVRVEQMRDAIQKSDFDSYLDLVNASGLSSELQLQNIHAPSAIEDQSLALALTLSRNFLQSRKGAVRVHGGGFAGTIQAYIHNDDKDAYIDLMDRTFGEGSAIPVNIRDIGATEVTK